MTETPAAGGKKKARSAASRLVAVVRNPIQVRVATTVLILGGWYALVAMPTAAEIDDVARKTTSETERITTAKEVERLRAQVGRFSGRLPAKTDPNEWVQYVLDGVRKFPAVRLSMLDTDGTKDVGPYKAVVLRMELEGKFEDLDAFLRWAESNPRLFRVDVIRLDPKKGAGGMTGQFTLVGVMG